MSIERIRTAEAARRTGLSVRTLQEKAAEGLIPGARKVFGRWSFDPRLLDRLDTAPAKRLDRASRSEVSSALNDAYEKALSPACETP